MPFKGREALLLQSQSPLKKMLCGFTVTDPGVVLHGRETIYRNGERAGWLSSGGYGHHLGCAIGYGYVRNESGVDKDYIDSGSYQLEVAAELVDCTATPGPLYDPSMVRVKS
jgi:4-methylaminobutanoate oxidase (formaldehyde-forming)